MRRAYPGLWLVLAALGGCDPTSGLADTADAALPPVKRYFDGAGTQLVEGPWSRVVIDINVDTQYHLGARRSDDEEPTFHLFSADAQTGCKVAPNAGTWLMGKADGAPNRLLPFAESLDERGRGRGHECALEPGNARCANDCSISLDIDVVTEVVTGRWSLRFDALDERPRTVELALEEESRAGSGEAEIPGGADERPTAAQPKGTSEAGGGCGHIRRQPLVEHPAARISANAVWARAIPMMMPVSSPALRAASISSALATTV